MVVFWMFTPVITQLTGFAKSKNCRSGPICSSRISISSKAKEDLKEEVTVNTYLE